MAVNESTMDGKGLKGQRVVEYELRMPRLDEIRLPKVRLEPWRAAAEEAVITGLGLGVLVAKGVKRAIEIAHEAGAQSSQQPGTVTHAVVQWLRPRPASPEGFRPVLVFALEDYDRLPAKQVVERLSTLSAEQRRALRAYELEHLRRTEVLKAIDSQTPDT